MDQLAVELAGQPPDSRAGRGRAQQGNVPLPAMVAAGGNQPFFERIGEVEAPIVPDVVIERGGKRNIAPP